MFKAVELAQTPPGEKGSQSVLAEEAWEAILEGVHMACLTKGGVQRRKVLPNIKPQIWYLKV